MNKVPDAWDDDWSNAVDEPAQPKEPESKKLTAKQTKAQKRAQQAEFNRQFWAEAEGPKDTNYFLESRNVVPLRQEFKAAPVLLSRKGPIVQKSARQTPMTTVEASLGNLKLKDKQEVSSDEEEEFAAKQKALEEAKAQAAKDREEKQRKYEERRLELFGPSTTTSHSSGNNTPSATTAFHTGRSLSRSGNSSPASLTPPGSRSSTPQRAARGRGGRRGNNYNAPNAQRTQQQNQQQQFQQQQLREVYDPGYSAKPGSTFLMRREQGDTTSTKEIQPIREPRAPDGSGLNGAGFLPRPVKYI